MLSSLRGSKEHVDMCHFHWDNFIVQTLLKTTLLKEFKLNSISMDLMAFFVGFKSISILVTLYFSNNKMVFTMMKIKRR